MLVRLAGYGASRGAVEGLLAARGIVLARLLGPELFGVWALMRLFLRYVAFAGLGLLRGLEVEVARAGTGRIEGAPSREDWGRAVVGHSLVLYGAMTVLAGLGWLVLDESAARLALAGLALALLANRFWMYGVAYQRAAGGLKRFALTELANAVLQVGLGVGFALVWGLTGAFGGFALAQLLGVLLLVGAVPLRPAWAPVRIRRLLKLGFPVSLVGILTATLTTIDRLLVGAFLGLAALGTYAFAVSLSELGVILAMVLRTVIVRDVYAGSGADRTGGAGRLLLERVLKGFGFVVPAAAGAVAIVMPAAIGAFAPEFRAGASVTQIYLFTAVLQGLINLALLGIVAVDRQGWLPAVAIGAVVLNVLLSLLAFGAGYGLTGVAVASLVARAAFCVAILTVLASSAASGSVTAVLSRLLGPALWCALLVVAIDAALALDRFAALPKAIGLYAVGLVPLLAAYLLLARRGAAG